MKPTEPYCIIVHCPSRRYFALNRAYELIANPTGTFGHPLDYSTAIADMEHTTVQGGWFPTGTDQSPGWAKSFPKHQFSAIWKRA